MMYENAFNNIELELRNEDGIANELDHVEQISWVQFLKYLHDPETERRDRAELDGETYTPIIDGPFRWDRWAAPKVNGAFDHNTALVGEDLIAFVDQKLCPTSPHFARRRPAPRRSTTRSAKSSPNCAASSARATSSATCWRWWTACLSTPRPNATNCRSFTKPASAAWATQAATAANTTPRARSSANLRANEKSRRYFAELLDAILAPSAKEGAVPIALSLAHFLADRLRPERHEVQSWVQRILHRVSDLSGPEADMIIATALLYHSTLLPGSGPMRSRRFLVKRGIDLETVRLDPDCISAFVAVLNPQVDLAAELHKARCAVTMGEQIRAYLAAADGRGANAGFDDLKTSRHWPKLLRGFQNPADFAKITVLDEATDFCPRKHILLPMTSKADLKSQGVAVCDCCSRLILNKDC